MKSLFFNVKENQFEVIEIEKPDLQFFDKKIGCDLIDIAVRKIDGKEFNIVLDEEGLLKEDPIVSAIDGNGNPTFVGNLMFFGGETTEDGGLVGLTDAEIDHILRSVGVAVVSPEGLGRIVIMNCEY